MEGILPDGASINRPPGFNGEHYSFWKSKFKVFVMATEYGLWEVIEDGNYVPTKKQGENVVLKPKAEFDEHDQKKVVLNSKAILMLQSALSQKEYFRICNLSSAKEMWDALEVAYEGTSGIKENRINTLMTEYDLLRMKSGESIGEFQLRFTHLINQLSVLGKVYEPRSQVRKILNVLTKDWEAKVTAIEEARGESMQSVAALFGSLTEYEGKLKFRKELDGIGDKHKSIALKTIKEDNCLNHEDNDEEIAMMVKRFRKFYKQEKGFRKFNKGNTSNDSKKPIVCYECDKPGHYKSECPQLVNKEKKKYNNFKKKAYVSAIWGDSSSDEEEEEDEKANICLVAQEENEEVNYSKPSYDDLLSEYVLIQEEYEKLAEKYMDLKRKNTTLEIQIKNISSENICENCNELEKKNLALTKTLQKFTNGSEMLNVILKEQRVKNDRSGIGYKSETNRKGKKRNSEKSYLNYFQKTVHTSNPFAFCNYCNRKGHTTSSCFHKKGKNKSLGNYQWVIKGSYKISKNQTNPKGPKEKWVPKT